MICTTMPAFGITFSMAFRMALILTGKLVSELVMIIRDCDYSISVGDSGASTKNERSATKMNEDSGRMCGLNKHSSVIQM
jgi:hypothetical protein